MVVPSGYAWLRAVVAILAPIMEYTAPQPPSESGTLDGIAYNLWVPAGAGPFPAVIVFHGAGSQKENHADYARAAVANGFAALTFDNRGHGQTEGALGPGVIADLQRPPRLAAHPPAGDPRRVAARGSRLGGRPAIPAGAGREPGAAGGAALPPPP